MHQAENIKKALTHLIEDPRLECARHLETLLKAEDYSQYILGRANQKSAIEAASQSDRGFTERLTNAFDASLTAIRLAAGLESTKALTPRTCAQQLLSRDSATAEWAPTVDLPNFSKPAVQMWLEDADAKNRFRKYNPGDGLATVLVRDYGTGLGPEQMTSTILALNSDSKLKTFEAIGQFGHGGSSALAFCESCLIISQPRMANNVGEFYWTLIVAEEDPEESKQQLLRKWFGQNGMPISAALADYPTVTEHLPGTSIWHFGYNRGGWINSIKGPSQSNPYGRMGRLLFSYPLPFDFVGELARGDSPASKRQIEGAFFRLLKQFRKDELDYYSDAISETLIVEGVEFGKFTVFIFALRDKRQVGNYVEKDHPIILTLNGQNHGELTRSLFGDANLPELSSFCIVEVRLDELDNEALTEVISNSRELPKNNPFTTALKKSLVQVLSSDEMLRTLEERRQVDKAKKSSSDLSAKISAFLSSILSDAVAEPDGFGRGTAPGTVPKEGKSHNEPSPSEPRKSKPDIPAADPPNLLEFLSTKIAVPEGSTVIAKFKSNARSPKYSFHGDNPRCFVQLDLAPNISRTIKITGKHEISPNGYGHVTVHCPADFNEPLTESIEGGSLSISIQCTDGKTLQCSVPILIIPRPVEQKRKRRSDVRANIVFVAPDDVDMEELKHLIVEENILPFSQATSLERYADALNISPAETSYWGDKTEQAGESVLTVEINSANPELSHLFKSCSTLEEKARIKERYVQDIVLDCYQHCFKLEDQPDGIADAVLVEIDDRQRAAEIHLNHLKAVRMAIFDRRVNRQLAIR